MKRITHCRACGSAALSPAFSVETALKPSGKTNLFRQNDNSDIEYVVCDTSKDANACGLLQHAECLDGERPAPPPSGAYRSTRTHLRAIATEGLELISGRDCAALDIGCSDGTLLSFYPRWVERFGVDSNDVVDHVGAWATTLKCGFPSRETDDAFHRQQFDVITAISVLEDIDEPRPFLANAKSLLSEDGVFIVETLYAPMVLTRTSAQPIFDRRGSIYSLCALERLFRDCGLKIFRGNLTDKDGGSIRLYVTHAEVEEFDFDPWYERLARLWDEENALALNMAAPYQAFETRIGSAQAAFETIMDGVRQRGETAHILGVGPAAAELYHWAGAGREAIEAAVSHFEPSSDDRLCPDGPLLIGEAEARALDADVLIAPASYKRDILERWRESILRGAKIIFATPQPEIVESTNFAAELGKSLSGGDGAGGPETLRAILEAAGGPRLVVDRAKAANA